LYTDQNQLKLIEFKIFFFFIILYLQGLHNLHLPVQLAFSLKLTKKNELGCSATVTDPVLITSKILLYTPA